MFLVACGAGREVTWMFWVIFKALQLLTEVWKFTSDNYFYCWCACWLEYSIQQYLSNFLLPQVPCRVPLFLWITFINSLQLPEPFWHSWRHHLSLEYVKRIHIKLSVCANLLQTESSINSSKIKIMRRQNIEEKALFCWVECTQKPIPVVARSAAARRLEMPVRIPSGAWVPSSCELCVLSGRGLCDGPITPP